MADILLVEDDDDIRTLLRVVLEDEGHRVTTANNGREALDALGSSRPSLMLVDLLMPVMDGVELIQQLRAHDRWSTIPLVVLSASSTVLPPADVVVLRKPIGIDALLDAVDAAVALNR